MCDVTGWVPLLLAALDEERGAAMGASLVLTLVVGSSIHEPATADPKLCAVLVRMGAVERLSQLLRPVAKTNAEDIRKIEFALANNVDGLEGSVDTEEEPDYGETGCLNHASQPCYQPCVLTRIV